MCLSCIQVSRFNLYLSFAFLFLSFSINGVLRLQIHASHSRRSFPTSSCILYQSRTSNLSLCHKRLLFRIASHRPPPLRVTLAFQYPLPRSPMPQSPILWSPIPVANVAVANPLVFSHNHHRIFLQRRHRRNRKHCFPGRLNKSDPRSHRKTRRDAVERFQRRRRRQRRRR